MNGYIFPTAGVEVSLWLAAPGRLRDFFFPLHGAGWVLGTLLILPFQMSLFGYTKPSGSATNQLFKVVAIPAGVWRIS